MKYSSLVFHVPVFDIVASHRLELMGIIHNELQDRKTELTS